MNDENRYDVIFRGEIVSDVTPNKVKENLTRLFKSPESTIEKLFSGKTITIKKAITEQKAHTYQQAMLKAGAIVKLRIVEDIETIDLPLAPKTDNEMTEIKKHTELVDDELPPPPAFDTKTKPDNTLRAPPSITDADDYNQLSTPPVEDITNAVDPLGKAPDAPDAPDAQWQIDNLGTRMSKPKQPFNKPLPRTDHIELSPEKSDVGQAKHIVKTINPDISHYVLAEIGSDMGQLIKVKELVNPDISHLDLADNTEASG